MKTLSKINILSMTPPEATAYVHRILQKKIKRLDLYKELKIMGNQEALDLYPSLKKIVAKAKDPLFTAIKLAIAGNVIDFGALERFDLRETIKRVLISKLTKNDYPQFKKILAKKARPKILYVGDNAGEIVFDRVLIEELNKVAEVTFAVKSKPSLNDVMMEDAQQIGLDKVCKVIKSGSTTPGTIWEETTPEYRKAFQLADMIIVKGQGGYETITDNDNDEDNNKNNNNNNNHNYNNNERGRIFYLLIVKCPHLAVPMQRKLGDLVFSRVIPTKAEI